MKGLMKIGAALLIIIGILGMAYAFGNQIVDKINENFETSIKHPFKDR